MASGSKGGRPRFAIDTKTLGQIEQLAGYGLTIGLIASVLGCSEKTLRRRKADEEAVEAAFEAGKAKAQAIVGKALFKRAEKGDVNAIRWWEMTRAGRSEKQALEHSGPAGAPIQVEVSDAKRRLAERLERANRGPNPSEHQ